MVNFDTSGRGKFGKSVKCYNFTNLPFYGFTASGSTTLRIYRFTVLPPLAPHAQLHWCMTPVRIYHFTALPSSPVHAVHEKNINLPLYGFTWVSFAFTSFTVHTSSTVLRFYGFTTSSSSSWSWGSRFNCCERTGSNQKNDPRRLASFIHPVACHISWSGIQPKTLRCRRSFCAVV